MNKTIVITIRYSHDDTCHYFDTHDNQDCNCGAVGMADETYTVVKEEKK